MSGTGNTAHVIVESAHVAAQLQRQLNKCTANTTVHATNGHLFSYRQDNGSIYIEPVKHSMAERIKRLDGDNIIVATDPDPQGELIATHVRNLTPNSKHKRCIFNDISELGVRQALHQFNQNAFQFDEEQAMRAALMKLVNIRIASESKGGLYLTTTGIDICKQFATIRRINKVQTRTFERKGVVYKSAVPSSFGNAVNMQRPNPAITRDLVLRNALEGNTTHVARELQDSFIQGMLSYTRTDFAKLPYFSEKLLSDHTLDGSLVDIARHLDFTTGQAHYALYNLKAAVSDVETRIKLQNRSALCTQYNDVNLIEFDTGVQLLADSSMIKNVNGRLSPTNELSALLSLSPDASPSNIEASATRYCRLFYNGNQLNTKLINASLDIAERKYPRLVEHGIHAALDAAITKHSTTELSNHINLTKSASIKKSQLVPNDLVDSLELS